MYSLLTVAPDKEEEKEKVMHSRSAKICLELISKQKHQTNVLSRIKISVKEPKGRSFVIIGTFLTNLACCSNVVVLSFQIFFVL